MSDNINEISSKEVLSPIQTKLVKLIRLDDNLIGFILGQDTILTNEGKEQIRQNILKSLGAYYEALLSKLLQGDREKVEKLIDINPIGLLESSIQIETFLAPQSSVNLDEAPQINATRNKWCTRHL